MDMSDVLYVFLWVFMCGVTIAILLGSGLFKPNKKILRSDAVTLAFLGFVWPISLPIIILAAVVYQILLRIYVE